MYPHTSTNSMLQQPGSVRSVSGPCCSAEALRITIYILGSLSLVFWGCCIGFTLGYCAYELFTFYGSFVSIPVNVGYVYVTCRIIFLVSGSTHVTPKVLVDLQRLNARMLALLIVGFSVWVTGVVWFCIYYQDDYSYDELYDDAFLTFFVANFGFMLTAVVVGLSGGLHDQYKRQVARSGSPINESLPQYFSSQQETPLQLTVLNPPAPQHYPRQPPPPVPRPEGYYHH